MKLLRIDKELLIAVFTNMPMHVPFQTNVFIISKTLLAIFFQCKK